MTFVQKYSLSNILKEAEAKTVPTNPRLNRGKILLLSKLDGVWDLEIELKLKSDNFATILLKIEEIWLCIYGSMILRSSEFELN